LGGFNGNYPPVHSLVSAELYEPATGIWTSTGSLNTARDNHVAILLPSGSVLVAAGYNESASAWSSSAEVYDSAPGPIHLARPVAGGGGSFKFAFTCAANGVYSVLTTTILALPLSDSTGKHWEVFTSPAVTEFSPGLFFFNGPQDENSPQRF